MTSRTIFLCGGGAIILACVNPQGTLSSIARAAEHHKNVRAAAPCNQTSSDRPNHHGETNDRGDPRQFSWKSLNIDVFAPRAHTATIGLFPADLRYCLAIGSACPSGDGGAQRSSDSAKYLLRVTTCAGLFSLDTVLQAAAPHSPESILRTPRRERPSTGPQAPPPQSSRIA
jgi:hypothetical protein